MTAECNELATPFLIMPVLYAAQDAAISPSRKTSQQLWYSTLENMPGPKLYVHIVVNLALRAHQTSSTTFGCSTKSSSKNAEGYQ